MKPETKERIEKICKYAFIAASLFSMAFLLRVTVINQQPIGTLIGKEVPSEYHFVPGLSELGNYTLETKNGESIEFIQTRVIDQNGDTIRYDFYIPTDNPFSMKDIKHHIRADNSIFQIINNAYADHNCPISRVRCSGTYYDSHGNYHPDGCWCI